MSDNLIPYIVTSLESSQLRRASRAIARSDAVAQVRIARVDAEAAVSVSKIESATGVALTALGALARLTMTQRNLELLSPESSARLSAIGDQAAISAAELLDDLRRDLRRK